MLLFNCLVGDGSAAVRELAGRVVQQCEWDPLHVAAAEQPDGRVNGRRVRHAAPLHLYNERQSVTTVACCRHQTTACYPPLACVLSTLMCFINYDESYLNNVVQVVA